MANYKATPLATLPRTLDPAEYFKLTPEKRRADEARTRLRAQLKRQYQIQLNNPHRTGMIADPALDRWVYARGHTHVYSNFRATRKTSLMGFMFGVVPVFVIWFGLKADRDRKEELIKAGKVDRTLKLTY